jgi:hypothetical protein
MSRLLLALVISLVGAAAFASEPTVSWRGLSLAETQTLAGLPAAIRAHLGVALKGLEGVAEKGAPFNATDVVERNLPMRRLLVAAHDGDTWLVAIEQGGRSHYTCVYLFNGGIESQQWSLPTLPRNLKEVVDRLPRGVAIDDG